MPTILLIAIVALTILAFEFAALRWGYDSRDGFRLTRDGFRFTRH